MDSAQSTSFRGLRELSVLWFVRDVGLSLSETLEFPRQEVLSDEKSLLINDQLLAKPPRYVLDYLSQRDAIFPQNELLFPTSDGQPYRPVKYQKRIAKLLQEAKAPTSPSHPAKLSDDQYQALLNLRFQLQRPSYQISLAAVLCCYLGLRPSEVAKLITTDLDFDNRVITLRLTKSQKDQDLPLLSFMIEPFKAYVHNLTKGDPLFINTQKLQWDRRDVTAAVSQWGKGFGVENLTSRKLRASLGAMLARIGVTPALLSKILRHQDQATALRHYNEMEVEDIRRLLENLHSRDFRFDRSGTMEFQRMYALLEADE